MMKPILVLGVMAVLFPCAAGGGEGENLAGTKSLGIRGWQNDWTGSYPDAKPVTAWNIEKGINVLWRLPTSRFGNAMPVVIGDRVCFTVDPDILVCVDKMTGKVLWTSLGAEPAAYARLFTVDANAAPWSSRKLDYGANAGSAFPTPVTDGKRIWYRSGGHVFCHDLADGNRLWETDTHQREGGGHFANIASPLLVGKVLVCDGGGNEYWSKNSKNIVPDGSYPPNPQTGKFSQWVVGLDAETGKILWDLGPFNAGGYSATGTPIPVIVNDGKAQRVFVMTPEGHVFRPEDGKLVIPFMGARVGCGTPFPLGNRVLFSSGLFEFSMDGPDKLVAQKVCSVRTLGNLGGPAYNNGMVYSGYRQAGAATRVEAATTRQAKPLGVRLYGVAEVATGRVVHMDVRGPEGLPDSPEWPAPSVAGKYLFFPTLNSIDVADISLGRPLPLALNLNERSHTGPVFDGDRMYLRTYDAITCIARKGEDGARYEREVNARAVIKAFPKELGKRAATEIRPIEDPSVWVGGPAFMYASGKTPDQWVFAGPFPKAEGKDALESLGGCAKASSQGLPAGKAVTFEGTTCTFAGVDARHIKPAGLDIDGPTKKDRKGQSFFFTWVIVGKPGYVTWNPRRPGVCLWVGGQEVFADQLLRLGKGAYPVLMRISLPEDPIEAADMVVDAAFAAADDPADALKKDIALVREGRDYLKLVIDALPGTDEAKQAAALLKGLQP